MVCKIGVQTKNLARTSHKEIHLYYLVNMQFYHLLNIMGNLHTNQIAVLAYFHMKN